MSAIATTLVLALAAAPDAGAQASGASPTPAVPSLLAPPTKSASATPADRSYELHRAKDGDLVYETPGFTARIARDGTARFIDHHFKLMGPWSLLAPVAPPPGQSSLQGLVVDLLGRRAPRRSQPQAEDPPPGPVPLLPTATPYRPDPREACTYPRPCFFDAGVVLVGVGGGFDLTDELMRLGGQDPYRDEKARFLAATSALRGGLAARALGDNVRRATKELPATLEEIACDARRPVRERRATIEALRDEIAGDTPAARDAVATIERFLSTRFEGDRAVRCPPAIP